MGLALALLSGVPVAGACLAPGAAWAQDAAPPSPDNPATADPALTDFEARLHAASEHMAAGDFDAAEAEIRAGQATLETAHGAASPLLARPLGALSRLRIEQGRYAESLTLIDQALAVLDEDGSAEQGRLLFDRGKAFDALGRYGEAEAAAQASLTVRRAVHGPSHELSADALNLYANTLAAQGRHAEADPLYRQVLGLYEVLHGPKDAHVSIVLSNLANSLRRTGRAGQAEPLYRRAVAIAEISGNRVLLAQNLNNYGWFLYEAGDSVKAEIQVRRALELAVGLVGPDHPFTGVARANIGYSLMGQGRHAEAEPFMAEGHRVLEAGLGPDSPDIVPTLRGRAMVLAAVDRPDEAEALHRQARRVTVTRLSPAHQERLRQADALAAFLLSRDRPDEALAELREGLSALIQNETAGGRDWRVGVRGAGPAFARRVTAAWAVSEAAPAEH